MCVCRVVCVYVYDEILRQDAFFRAPGTLARRLKAATIHRRDIKIHHNGNLGFLHRACCPSRVSQISTSRWRSYPPQLPHRWTSSPEQPYWRSGFTFSFFYRIPPTAGNEISAEILPNFANSEWKENSNSKNEISMNSDGNFGDFEKDAVFDFEYSCRAVSTCIEV